MNAARSSRLSADRIAGTVLVLLALFAPLIFTEVTAAPSRELTNTRRSELPTVCPDPASKGLAMNLA